MNMSLPVPTLMLVTDRHLAGGEDQLVEKVAQAVEAGVNVVQLREKDLPEAQLVRLADRLRGVIDGRALLIINGPHEVALDSGADGVHLPEGAPVIERHRRPDLSLAFGGLNESAARPELRGLFVGRSVHSLAAALRAQEEGADYLVAGPVYETWSHPSAAPTGLALISQISGTVQVPVLGIGGIDAHRVADVMRAGAAGVAVISAILGAASPSAAARALRAALEAAAAGVVRS